MTSPAESLDSSLRSERVDATVSMQPQLLHSEQQATHFNWLNNTHNNSVDGCSL
ncbi:hypothetical protein BCEP4_790008 [Burkholderia cepacia]|nr:hypothetical protein BCEP4_790008 [Burkholderia cepacia]